MDKEEQKTDATVQKDLGSESEYETNIIAMGSKDISNASSKSSIQSSNLESDNSERK